MKTKKPTKKEILTTLKSLDCEKIISIASRCGIDTSNMDELVKFITLCDNINFLTRYLINNMLYDYIIGDGNFHMYMMNNYR